MPQVQKPLCLIHFLVNPFFSFFSPRFLYVAYDIAFNEVAVFEARQKKENPLQGKIATLMRICEVEEVVEVIETVDENLQSSQGRIFID